MGKHTLVATVVVGSLFLASAAQERVKPKGPADFAATLERAGKAWSEGSYGRCLEELNTCLELAFQKRSEAIRAALPAAPEGWTVPATDARNSAQANPFAAAMAGTIGNVVEHEYRQTSGGATAHVTVTADSSLVPMLAMMFGNAALDPESEEIKYGTHRALLKKQGERLILQILVSEAHVVEVRLSTTNEDFLFSLFDQAAVDRLAAALST
jgi:hypothetical protein